VRLEGSRGDWRLLLKPRDSKIQAMVAQIRVAGREQQVRVIEVMETGGDRSEMTIIEDGS
jgi:hypothetical protein